jgi:GGDEF domain-containing protein
VGPAGIEKIIGALSRRLEAAPDDPVLLRRLGLTQLRAGDANRAAACLERLVGTEFATARMMDHLGAAYRAVGPGARRKLCEECGRWCFSPHLWSCRFCGAELPALSVPRSEPMDESAFVLSEVRPYLGDGEESSPRRIVTRRGEACFVSIYGWAPGTIVALPLSDHRAEVSLGSSLEADIQIPVPSVSRLHASLRRDSPGRYRVHDLRSRAGSYVEFAPARSSTPLADGSTLALGQVLLRFLCGPELENAAHEEVFHLAVREGVSGAYLWSWFEELLSRDLLRIGATCYRRFALAHCEIDRLDAIEQAHGAMARLFVLRAVSERIRGALAPNHRLIYGAGDALAILMPGLDLDDAEGVAQVAMGHVAGSPIEHDGETIRLSLSVGLSTCAANSWFPDRAIAASRSLARQAALAGGDRLRRAGS